MREITTDERISMRTNRDTKKLLETAAHLSGFNSLSSFILHSAYQEAKKIVNEKEIRSLSEKDRDLFLEGLRYPSQPTKILTNLLKEAPKYHKED
jgi:uncharacterized protein (DUF1778 family)